MRHDVASHYRMLDANAVAIDVDAYNTDYALVIDPIIDWGRYVAE